MLQGALSVEPVKQGGTNGIDSAGADASSTTVRSGDPVRFRFTVTNTGDEPVTLRFRDACKADFVVSPVDGETEQWRWSNEQLFAQVIEKTTVGPTEQETFEAGWKAESGKYTVHAELLATGHSCEAESTLSVT